MVKHRSSIEEAVAVTQMKCDISWTMMVAWKWREVRGLMTASEAELAELGLLVIPVVFNYGSFFVFTNLVAEEWRLTIVLIFLKIF